MEARNPSEVRSRSNAIPQSGVVSDQPLVLVVDDDPDARIIWSSCLSYLGYRTSTEPNGERGVRSALRQQPLAILMDLGMPDLEGLDATKRIKAHSRTHDCFVIVVTGRGPDSLEEARAAGCDAYFCKPFDAFLFDAILRTFNAFGERDHMPPRVTRCPCRREYGPETWSSLHFRGRVFGRKTSDLRADQALEIRTCVCGCAIAMLVRDSSSRPAVIQVV